MKNKIYWKSTNRSLDNIVVIGYAYDRIADNQYKEISKTLFDYHKGSIKHEDAIQKIKWKNDFGDQFCFKTEKALSKIGRVGTYIQYKDSVGKWKIEKR